MMKSWQITGVSVLAIGLFLGLASPALAAPDWAASQAHQLQPNKLLRGEVVSIDEDEAFFVIKSGWWQVTVLVDDETEYFKASVPQQAVSLASRVMEQHAEGLGFGQRLRSLVAKVLPIPQRVAAVVSHQLKLRPQIQERVESGEQAGQRLGAVEKLCPFVEGATFADITVGSRVVVMVVPGEDGPLAKRVSILEPTTYDRIRGTITDISSEGEDKTVTIDPFDDGSEVTLNYNEATRFVLHGATELKLDDCVGAVYSEDMTAQVVFMLPEAPELTE